MHGLSVLVRLKPRSPTRRIPRIPHRYFSEVSKIVRDAFQEAYVQREMQGADENSFNPTETWEKSESNQNLKMWRNSHRKQVKKKSKKNK